MITNTMTTAVTMSEGHENNNKLSIRFNIIFIKIIGAFVIPFEDGR
jgi:hypothetical protein